MSVTVTPKEGFAFGYHWYYSGLYTCWMVVSPVSGFWSPFVDEEKAIKFIEKESGKCLQRKPMAREQSAPILSASKERIS